MQTIPNSDSWLLARGERDGFPMIIRMATAYRGLGGLPGYDHHVIVGATQRNPSPAGLPSAEEGDDLANFELNLCRALEIEEESVCVLVITNQGLRDFIFYTRNANGAKEKIEAARSELRAYHFEIAIEPDPHWEIYQAFEEMLAPPSKPN